jgi:hypothetical protein
MKEDQTPRRQFLRISAAAVAMIPVIAASGRADAATNAALRTSLKYQGKPEGDKSCQLYAVRARHLCERPGRLQDHSG